MLVYYITIFIFLLGIVILCLLQERSIWKARCKMSFKEALDLTELPVVTFYNGGKKINFLLDTGSNASYFNIRDVERLEKYERINKVSAGIVTGSSVVEETHGYIRIPLEYRGTTYSDDFVLYDISDSFNNIKKESGVSIHGILGNQFFTKYKYVLDFDKMIAYMK